MYGQHENSHVTAKFVKDTSKYWYKPTISREEGKSVEVIVYKELILSVDHQTN